MASLRAVKEALGATYADAKRELREEMHANTDDDIVSGVSSLEVMA